MRPAICLLTMLVLVGTVLAEPAETETPESDDRKTLYVLGFAMSAQLSAAEFSEAEVELIQEGLADGLLGRDSRVEPAEYAPKIDPMIRAKLAAATEREKKESLAYCESKAAEEGAQMTAAGAIYFEVEAGSGATPAATDSVKLHYHGTLRDGTVFDSSVDRGEPAVFALNRVVPCFSEGLQMMKVGGKAKLVCPPDTAYGDRGSPPKIRPGAALNFEVELLEIVE